MKTQSLMTLRRIAGSDARWRGIIYDGACITVNKNLYGWETVFTVKHGFK